MVSNLPFFWILPGFSEDVMEWPKKIQVGISSCSLFSDPTSSKITGTLGKLRGYLGFSSNFSLHFLFCIRPVETVCFLSYFEGILAIYCCTCNIHMQYLYLICAISLPIMGSTAMYNFLRFGIFERSEYKIHHAHQQM